MQEMPWMKLDFDMRQALAADAPGSFRASLEWALDELTRRLEMRHSVCRDPSLREQIDALLAACESSRAVIEAFCAAVSIA